MVKDGQTDEDQDFFFFTVVPCILMLSNLLLNHLVYNQFALKY